MKIIRSTNGYEIPVDDEDYDAIVQFGWFVEFCGRKTKKPRVYTNIGGKKRAQKVYLSRMLMREPLVTVDHDNGDTLDHQRSNLRLATQKQNSRNRRKHHPLTSKYKGVSLRRNRRGGEYRARPWTANISVDGKRMNLGHHEEEIDAAQAYDRAAIRHFGEFARTNF